MTWYYLFHPSTTGFLGRWMLVLESLLFHCAHGKISISNMEVTSGKFGPVYQAVESGSKMILFSVNRIGLCVLISSRIFKALKVTPTLGMEASSLSMHIFLKEKLKDVSKLSLVKSISDAPLPGTDRISF
jgi:hypothetical protein